MQHTRPGLTALAGQIIGYRKDGRPIRLQAGGSTDSDTSTTGTDSTTDDGPADKDGQDDNSSKPKIEGDVDPERVARTLAAAREGEKKAKERAKAADERVAAILKAAGLAPDGKTDPAEQLKAAAEERDKALARVRENAVELAVYKSAGKAGADPDAVLDSRGFLRSVSELDPDTADFGDKVTAAVKAALKANPKLAAASPSPGKQGADHSGGGGQRSKPKNLTEAITAKLGGS